MRDRLFTAAKIITPLLASGGLVACAATQPEGPKPTVKQVVETAPADLQLACANQASLQFGATAGTVLPVSSARTGDASFVVDLSSQAGQFRCSISQDGVISSLVPIAPEPNLALGTDGTVPAAPGAPAGTNVPGAPTPSGPSAYTPPSVPGAPGTPAAAAPPTGPASPHIGTPPPQPSS
ncbi:MAG: hypothetical protein AAFW47_07565 [Pseudomonadota bacterium]